MEGKVKSVSALRALIRESLTVIEEGGHGGMLSYVQVPDLFALLDAYSIFRKSHGPSIEVMKMFLDDLSQVAGSARNERILGAYSTKSEMTSPISRAQDQLGRAEIVDPRIAAEYGSYVDVPGIEKQILKTIGVGLRSPGDPSSRVEDIFGAGLDWSSYPGLEGARGNRYLEKYLGTVDSRKKSKNIR